MFILSLFNKPNAFGGLGPGLAILLLAVAPTIGNAGIIWRGDFETGNFMQYHDPDNRNTASFWAMPHSHYGAPKPINLGPGQSYVHTGDGSWAEIVTSPTRFSSYAARLTVKNSVNGREPDDCDSSKQICTRRRTQLNMQRTIPDYYNGIPYMAERWLSFSVYIPSDWDDSGSGFGPNFFGTKPRNESGLSGALGILLENGAWTIKHRWSPVRDPSESDIPWQYGMFYAGNYQGDVYPSTSNWPEGLKDFPDVQASTAALKSVNKGGWTDWIVHFRTDARGASDGGTGFMEIWKREDEGPWIQVLNIVPKVTSRGGMTFDHGIWYNSPPQSTNNGGFGVKVGLYMDKGQVWNHPNNRTIYIDNIKLGDANAAFSDMSPDGSAPGQSTTVGDTPPMPPQLQSVE